MRKSIVTTSWDDGHVLDLKVAQLLTKYNLPGTFYISPESNEIIPKNRLTKHQIKDLGRNFEIGGHTIHHVNLPNVTKALAFQEIAGSKYYLENIIQSEITSFCYPYGSYDQDVKHLVKEAGYLRARTTKRFSIDNTYDLFAMPTTIHVYDHKSDFQPVLFWKHKTIAPLSLTKKYFDEVMKTGGIFHLWGHSWEIEKYKKWDELEKIFAYIANKTEITYVTNANML